LTGSLQEGEEDKAAAEKTSTIVIALLTQKEEQFGGLKKL